MKVKIKIHDTEGLRDQLFCRFQPGDIGEIIEYCNPVDYYDILVRLENGQEIYFNYDEVEDVE